MVVFNAVWIGLSTETWPYCSSVWPPSDMLESPLPKSLGGGWKSVEIGCRIFRGYCEGLGTVIRWYYSMKITYCWYWYTFIWYSLYVEPLPAFSTLTSANKCTHTILCQSQYLNINIYHYLPRLIQCDCESLLLFGMKAFLEFNACFDLLDVLGNLSLVILAARCQDPSLYCWFHISLP